MENYSKDRPVEAQRHQTTRQSFICYPGSFVFRVKLSMSCFPAKWLSFGSKGSPSLMEQCLKSSRDGTTSPFRQELEMQKRER